MARIDLVDLAHSYSGNSADEKTYALKPISIFLSFGSTP